MDAQRIAHRILTYGRAQKQRTLYGEVVLELPARYKQRQPTSKKVHEVHEEGAFHLLTSLLKINKLKTVQKEDVDFTLHKTEPATISIESKSSKQFRFTFPCSRIVKDENGSDVLVPPTLVEDLTKHILFPEVPWKEDVYAPIFKWCAEYAEATEFNAKTCNRLNALDTKVAYLNFKSHFIFDELRRKKMESLIERISNLRFLCLAEALVPDSIAQQVETELPRVTPISQPFSGLTGANLRRGSSAFWKFKVEKNLEAFQTEIRSDGSIKWMPKYEAGDVIFGNPYFCPYGSNWGNVVLVNGNASGDAVVHHLFPHADEEIITLELEEFNVLLNNHTHVSHDTEEQKKAKDETVMSARHALSDHAKEALAAIREHHGGMQGRCLESRCMIQVSIPGYVVFSTHLEDRVTEVREAQIAEAIRVIQEVRDEGVGVLLLGDLNMIHINAYTLEEQNRLKALLRPGAELPELDARLMSTFTLCNPYVKHESMFCKNVCHIFSAEGGGNQFRDIQTGCVYSDAGDHSMQVVGWNSG